MSEPYCPTLRNFILKAGSEMDASIHPYGTYVCTEGPRFETPAEISMFSKLGGDIVGMTNVPEVCLAREAEMCYATISMVTNYAAGISSEPMAHAEVVARMKRMPNGSVDLSCGLLNSMTTVIVCVVIR